MSLLRNSLLKLRFKVFAKLRLNHFASYNLSHSQFGEDMVVRALLEDVRDGTYVDIGAHHPVFYSNTYHFYTRGWSGINIDASPGSMAPFRVLRPRDINLEACIGPNSGEPVTFHIFDQPAFNTTDHHAAAHALHHARLLEKRTLTTMTLGECLDKHLNGRKIDLMTIDVEGLDESILQSNDWSRYKPRVLVFECQGLGIQKLAHAPVFQLLADNGYDCVGKCGPSLIMALPESQAFVADEPLTESAQLALAM